MWRFVRLVGKAAGVRVPNEREDYAEVETVTPGFLYRRYFACQKGIVPMGPRDCPDPARETLFRTMTRAEPKHDRVSETGPACTEYNILPPSWSVQNRHHPGPKSVHRCGPTVARRPVPPARPPSHSSSASCPRVVLPPPVHPGPPSRGTVGRSTPFAGWYRSRVWSGES